MGDGFSAAAPAGQDPDRLSDTGGFRILHARLPEGARARADGREHGFRDVGREMSREALEPRRNRINPRVVKRQMSKGAKKRPHHRHPPPLTKTVAEAVVIE